MIDFRSDTVTKPCKNMRQAMSQAKVGDDVFGDDPTVNQVEKRVAEMLGMPSAMFVPSGTQSNLIALLTHCGRGDEYLVGQEYHTYFYEAGGAACLGGIQPQPIAVEKDGSLDLEMIKQRIKPDDYHFAKTRLLSLENTHCGKILCNQYLSDAISLAKQHNLSTHLDGARIFNAAVEQQIDVSQISKGFDSVSVCFSKGLGAPIGSMLCGSSDFIHNARRWRKMVGGGMRQSGILAAAIDYALDNNISRLADDHNNANLLAELLKPIEGIAIDSVNTNMLYLSFTNNDVSKLVQTKLKQKAFLIPEGKSIRLVTHLDISQQDIYRFVDEIKLIIKR